MDHRPGRGTPPTKGWRYLLCCFFARGAARCGRTLRPTPPPPGLNDFGDVGSGGPCPPEGETHTYVFRLLALDAALDLPPGTDRASFDAGTAGHVIAEARLEAPYTRGG